jgi:hypothetical protein
MIAPDAAAEFEAERRFDLLAAFLIGAIAVLAAVLAVVQISSGQAATRAQIQAARLTADLSARLEVSSVAQDAAYMMLRVSVAGSTEALARQIAGLENQDDNASAIGTAAYDASKLFDAAVLATARTIGKAPVDAYMNGLLNAEDKELQAEVAEQNRQVDLANAAGAHNTWSVLGLSLLALAGVLTGLAAVLREGRAGSTALAFAGAMTVAAGYAAVLGVI